MVVFLFGVAVGSVATTLYLERQRLRRELKDRLRRFVEEDEPALETGAPSVSSTP